MSDTIENNQQEVATKAKKKPVSDVEWSLIMKTEKFDPENESWQNFRFRVERVFRLVGLDDDQKKKFLYLLMSAKTSDRVFYSLDDIESMSLKEVEKKMTSEFRDNKFYWCQLRQFNAACKAPGESVKEYYFRLLKSAENCKFDRDELKIRVRDQLIVGLPWRMFFELIDLPRDVGLNEALQKCEHVELMVQYTRKARK